MSLEEEIVAWAATRPAWQRALLRRAATGEPISSSDYDELVDALLTSRPMPDVSLGLDQFPPREAGDAPVALVSIANPEHVNALVSEEPLTFDPMGLTIVYGDNGSGKSGYARLLKRIARARHREEVLSDVFHDTSLAKPRAALTIAVADQRLSIDWPESTPPELQRILFYDEACGQAYIATESDFPYRPSALATMEGLVDACLAVRARIETRLEQNGRAAKPLPPVDEDARGTDIGRFLLTFSWQSSLDDLDTILAKLQTVTEGVEDLRDQEILLQSAAAAKERQKLMRRAAKLDALQKHLRDLDSELGDQAVLALEKERQSLGTIEHAADLLAKAFDSESLSGVGSSLWNELWDSARHYSEAHAYLTERFPVVTQSARCVLCHQPLQEEGRERLLRFEAFVRNDTLARLRDARARWQAHVNSLIGLRTTPEVIETYLRDLETDHEELVARTRILCAAYEALRTGIIPQLSGMGTLPRFGLEPAVTWPELQATATAIRSAAEGLSTPEKVRERFAAVTARRKELELLQVVTRQRTLFGAEISRLRERAVLEGIKSGASTGPITKKILELSEGSITEVVRDAFTREADRLLLERVTITKTRGDKGTLLHQPKLVGARQSVTLPRVFSEGEQTALGLAAFFTEAHLDASRSALILDDPVSSLDHIRRGLVAARLAELAEVRQVVVFTHDVAFVADLKREAKGLGVVVTERSVTRGRGGERKPGACGNRHPWKARDVNERLGELRGALARMKRDRTDWDDTAYETQVATWAGNLSETWERIFSQELVGPVLAEGGLEVRPNMVKVLARFSESDEREFQASYSRSSQWAKRHDKSGMVNYVAPDISVLEQELERVTNWFSRVKGYKTS